MMKVGILAIQGNFLCHSERINELGGEALLVKKASDLELISGLIIPGGESTTLLRMLDGSMRDRIISLVNRGLPTLVTCAGLILAAREVTDPVQESLNLIDVSVRRNAYGRQLHSFINESLNWTRVGRDLLNSLDEGEKLGGRAVEGVFIRAPKITAIGERVEVLIENGFDPVLVRDGNILGATFHPELSNRARSVHQLFLHQVLNAP